MKRSRSVNWIPFGGTEIFVVASMQSDLISLTPTKMDGPTGRLSLEPAASASGRRIRSSSSYRLICASSVISIRNRSDTNCP